MAMGHVCSDSSGHVCSRLPALLDSWLTPEFEKVLEHSNAILLMKPHPNDENVVPGSNRDPRLSSGAL